MAIRSMKPFLLLAAGMLLLLVLAIGTVVTVAHFSVERRIEALRAAGEPVCLADLQIPPIPDDENAYIILNSVEKEVEELWQDWEFIESLGLWVPLDVCLRAAAVQSYPPVSDAFRRAADAEHSRIDLSSNVWINLERFVNAAGNVRRATRTLTDHAKLQTVAGRNDSAINDVMTILRLAHHEGLRFGITSWLMETSTRSVAIGLANGVLRAGNVSARTRESLERVIAEELANESSAFREVLRGERAKSIEMNRALQSSCGWTDYHGLVVPLGLSAILSDTENELAAIDQPMEIVPFDAKRELKSTIFWGRVYPFHRPFKFWRAARARHIVEMRSLLVLLAILRHQEAGGVMPVAIEDLGLAPDQITDPFSNRPLLLRFDPDGPVIYSVGDNGVDDGGQRDGSGKDDLALRPNDIVLIPRIRRND